MYLLLFFSLVSCNNSENASEKIKIAKDYFEALNQSNASNLDGLLADSLINAIPGYDYTVTFSKDDYLHRWLKWDSVFNPTYKILDIKFESGRVKAKISKSDKRIQFLMQKPFITNETLAFQNDKIVSIETEYLNFDDLGEEQKRTCKLDRRTSSKIKRLYQ